MPDDDGFELEEVAGAGAPITSRSLRAFAWERAGMVVAFIGFVVLVVKVTRVAHSNPRTAHSVLVAVGPLEIVLAEAVTHFSWLLFSVGIPLAWWASDRTAPRRSSSFAAAIAVLVLAAILLPWPLVLGLLGIAIWRRLSSAPSDVVTRRKSSYLFVLVAALLLIVVDSDVWLPPEVFRMKDGTSVVGYFLGESDSHSSWVTILTEQDRSVRTFSEEDVVERVACRMELEGFEVSRFPSLATLLAGESGALPEPPCPV